MFQLSGEMQFSIEREVALYGQEPRPLVPDLLFLMHIRTSNPHSLIGLKSTALIDQKRATLIGWSCIAPIGWGKLQCYWLKYGPGTPL